MGQEASLSRLVVIAGQLKHFLKYHLEYVEMCAMDCVNTYTSTLTLYTYVSTYCSNCTYPHNPISVQLSLFGVLML